MTDLVERLNRRADNTHNFGWLSAEMREAAAEITHLREEVRGHRSEQSAVAKALAWQTPYQASLAKRAEDLIARVETYQESASSTQARIKELEAAVRALEAHRYKVKKPKVPPIGGTHDQ